MSSKQAIHFYRLLAYKTNPKSEPIELEAAMNIYHGVLYVHIVIAARGKKYFSLQLIFVNVYEST